MHSSTLQRHTQRSACLGPRLGDGRRGGLRARETAVRRAVRPSSMMRPICPIHGVRLLYHVHLFESFSAVSAIRHMPLHLYAGAMMHDWCEAKGFSKYEKEISKHCDDLDDVADLEMTDIDSIAETTDMALVKKRKFVQAVDDSMRHRASGAPMMSAIQVRRWVLYVIW